MMSEFWAVAERYKYAFLIGAFFAAIGWLFTSRQLVTWLDGQIPITILVFWYMAVFAPLVFIFGRAHKGDKFGHRHTAAVVMFFLAFSLSTSMGTGYISSVTSTDASPILESSEAGVAYDFFTRSGISVEWARLATHVVLPFVLVVGAAIIYKPEFVLQAVKRQ